MSNKTNDCDKNYRSFELQLLQQPHKKKWLVKPNQLEWDWQ